MVSEGERVVTPAGESILGVKVECLAVRIGDQTATPYIFSITYSITTSDSGCETAGGWALAPQGVAIDSRHAPGMVRGTLRLSADWANRGGAEPVEMRVLGNPSAYYGGSMVGAFTGSSQFEGLLELPRTGSGTTGLVMLEGEGDK